MSDPRKVSVHWSADNKEHELKNISTLPTQDYVGTVEAPENKTTNTVTHTMDLIVNGRPYNWSEEITVMGERQLQDIIAQLSYIDSILDWEIIGQQPDPPVEIPINITMEIILSWIWKVENIVTWSSATRPNIPLNKDDTYDTIMERIKLIRDSLECEILGGDD